VAVDVARLEPSHFAALVAPAISRTFVSGITAGREKGSQLVEAFGGHAVGYLIDLRNPLAAGRPRPITPVGLAAVYRYTDPSALAESIDRSVAHGLLTRDSHGALRATDRGHEFLGALFAYHAEVLNQRWPSHFVDPLNELMDRVLDAAATTSGEASAVQAPPFEPDGTAPAVLLLNRLSTMRYHRADAHVAAWQAAGWTAAQVAAEPWGGPWSEQRQAIEDETNRRAAPPYEGLAPDERVTLLGHLPALT
jgi:hypothetical protein